MEERQKARGNSFDGAFIYFSEKRPNEPNNGSPVGRCERRPGPCGIRLPATFLVVGGYSRDVRSRCAYEEAKTKK